MLEAVKTSPSSKREKEHGPVWYLVCDSVEDMIKDGHQSFTAGLVGFAFGRQSEEGSSTAIEGKKHSLPAGSSSLPLFSVASQTKQFGRGGKNSDM